MVVSKPEFQRALAEINESYAKLVARIEALEAKQTVRKTTVKETKDAA